MRTLIALLFALSVHAQEFRPEAIRGHMRFLADDLLEGRGTGTRGYDLAARYVAAQYEAAGVKPGANGSYYQTIPFRRAVAVPEQTSVVFERAGGESLTLPFGDGFTTSGSVRKEEANAHAEVVFVGFGVTAPSEKYDDYAGLDVRGKVVAYFGDAPSSFSNDVRAHYSSSAEKQRNAAAHGAVAVFTLTTPERARRSPWARSVRQSRHGSMFWLEKDGTPHAAPQLEAVVSLSQDAIASLFLESPVPLTDVLADIKTGKPKSFALPLRARIRVVSRHERVDSPNVVGLVEGSDPKLKHEYVVYTSHLDHVGITEPVDGDAINNGAFDNASGIAALIEIARAFASRPKPPRRSILFVATTAEEKGLKGADYFAVNPTVPAGALVANINIDQIFMFTAMRDVVAIGAEHSTLGDAARRVSKKSGILISPDPMPEEVVFVRSDQYPFVRRGIPAIYVGSGSIPVDEKFDLEKTTDEWIRTRYHAPKDDLDQPIDYSVGAMVARFDYLLGLEVANATARPRWHQGDFFGEMFAK